MDINLIRTIVTVASFIAFLAIVAWAMHAGNRQRFEDASRLPFDEDATLSPSLSQGRGSEGGTRFHDSSAES